LDACDMHNARKKNPLKHPHINPFWHWMKKTESN
jgi:hypothetical protein